MKNDPQYGGCAVMLGVPTYFRDLNADCLPDPYLHQVMASADIIMPWAVQRFTPLLHEEPARYAAQVKADLAWCDARHLEYAPCIYPGFSWYNLSKTEFGDGRPLDQIPREKGKFYWDLAMPLYRRAQKCFTSPCLMKWTKARRFSNVPTRFPSARNFATTKGLPSDHYLWLTGQIGKMLRGEIPSSSQIPNRTTGK
ncbi:MAG: hypothetical protein WDM76_04010 [Limisphaerales bacterium]